MEVSDFPRGTHAQITGLAAKPELNNEYCVSWGVSDKNPERVNVMTQTGAQLALRPLNLKPAELLPGSRVAVHGLTNAAKYNGQRGEVLSWQGDRWIVDLDSKERKSFKAENLVLLPELVSRKRAAPEQEEPDAKRVKTAELNALQSRDERTAAQALLRCMTEFPVLAQKCVCVLATKQTMTVMHELAQHLTGKQNDGYLRKPLRAGEKVKGIEELDPIEQCHAIAERRVRALVGHININYCDLLGFIKAGMQEPKFNRKLPTQ